MKEQVECFLFFFISLFPYLRLSRNGFRGLFQSGLHPSDRHVRDSEVPAVKTAVVHDQDKPSRGGWG